MKNINQKIKDLLPYLFVVLAIMLPLFLKPGYLFFTDFVFGPNVRPDWINGGIAYNLFIAILSAVLPMDIVEKIIIAGAISFILLGGRKIAQAFLSDKWQIFIVSLFVLFNPFVYDRLMYGQISNVTLAFGCFCLSVGYLFEYIEKRGDGQFLFAGLFTALSIQFSMHFAFFAGVFWILSGILLAKGLRREDYRKIGRNIIIVLLLIFVINLNLFLGLFQKTSPAGQSLSGGISSQDLVAFQTSGSNGVDALRNVVMMSGFWGKDQYRYLDITKLGDNWGRSFMLLILLILLGFVIMLKGKGDYPKEKRSSPDADSKSSEGDMKIKIVNCKYFALGLFALYMIAVVLAAGIRLPIVDGITYWLFNHFPFYKGLRETQKWVAVVVVIYAIFLAVGIKNLFKVRIVRENGFIVGLFLIGVIIMQSPLLLWGFGGQVRPTEYPNDWHEANGYIVQDQEQSDKKQSCKENVLFLPWHMYMSFSWIGNVVISPAKYFFACPVISGTNMEWGGIYDNSQNYEGGLVNDYLAAAGGTDMLSDNKLDIRYIILAKELDWRNYLWLENDPEVTLVKETETLRIYKVVAN